MGNRVYKNWEEGITIENQILNLFLELITKTGCAY